MAVSEDRKYTGQYVYNLLEGVKGRTLGEVDDVGSRQFARTEKSSKITGIAGDVIEQSVFCYDRDSKQECDIEIDGVLTELKTTGVRVPKTDLAKVRGKSWEEYSSYFSAKEGISITGVTFEPSIQRDFATSHFWEKSERLLIVFYEYASYDVVPAAAYRDFRIVGYCYNTFSEAEKSQLRSDWEIVRDYLAERYDAYENAEERNRSLVGFTHVLRPQLMLIELVPGFKRRNNGSYQRPRYRLKKTFVDHIVRGHFRGNREEVSLGHSFSSFAELDARCHALAELYKGKTLAELKEILGVELDNSAKNFTSGCIIKMFGADCKRLNQISDFTKAGIIAKTITITPSGGRTEDMKLASVDFSEWTDRDIDFEDSAVYSYFSEHSFLCPVFCERDKNDASGTTFEGFKRFAFDEDFLQGEVRRTWQDARNLIHRNQLVLEVQYNKRTGMPILNNSGGFKAAPNLPKSSAYTVFFRGGAKDSSEASKTEVVNNIRMLPQFFWLKGSYITSELEKLPYL